MNPHITVVICTFNRFDLLPDAIASIELQDFPADSYELIVVDNSDDLEAQERFRNGLEITCKHRYLTEARPGLSRARNIGVNAASSEIVVFMDDDAKAAPDWLTHIAETFFQYERAGITGGPVRPIWTVPRPQWLNPWLEPYLTILDRGATLRVLQSNEWLAGTNIAFRTQPLKQVGLFPENLGRVGQLLLSNEELIVSDRLRASGYDVLYNPEIVVHHRVHAERVSQSWLRRRVFWQAISDLFIPTAERASQAAADGDIHRVFDYLARLAPRDRGLMGLFLDLDDPQLFTEQTEAIAALVRFLAGDSGDWRRILATATQGS
jgi:glycosyltransferase involved in cell wall biosynthesis